MKRRYEKKHDDLEISVQEYSDHSWMWSVLLYDDPPRTGDRNYIRLCGGEERTALRARKAADAAVKEYLEYLVQGIELAEWE